MRQEELLLKKEEQVVFELRRLFEQYGYRRFEMSKFEEYDFYAENRSFLDSENILTFTGLDGKLLALKPDVTLSIVKNSRGSLDAADRVYYNENVYRARKEDKEYREIMQAGLEYIGPVDTYAVLEVLLLAKRCLEMIDGSYLMDLSHMGLVAGLLEETGLVGGKKKRLLKAIREKNVHELHEICESEGVSEEAGERLAALASIYGPFKETLPAVKALCRSERTRAAYAELSELSRCLEACGELSRVSLDFSVVNDMDYYNGITFQGFIEGIPNGVLSGGRYDSLVHKLGKRGGAVGFAVYVHLLERFWTQEKDYDTDVLLLYGKNADPAAVARAVKKLTKNGERVMACRENTGDMRFKRLLSMEGGEE
ncbi:MAG: hypothetical protein HFE83_11795 [Lachnospiraceae bacterium]|jgi:ATP phosphoribosyltransferase regulatory subunit|nr:hypothetical protein [Lachnospiraceae bacterium]